MDSRGFTLLELLVVIAVIGILAAIAIPAFSVYRQRAWDAKVQSMVRTFATSQEAYAVENESYLDCQIDNGVSTCGALPGIGSMDLTGFSGVQFNLPDGMLIGLCHVNSLHGYAFVTDPGHRFYTGGRVDPINLDGPGSCALSFFPSAP